jgi:methionyl aminopeptidase
VIDRKSDRELEIMREAGRITALALRLVGEAIEPGVTTSELDAVAERAIRGEGARPAFKGYHGFPASICASRNHEVVHGIPEGDRPLADGDILSVDVGAIIDGYYGDAAMTFPVGDVDPSTAHLLETTRLALEAGITKCRPDMRLYDISSAVQAVAEEAGFSVVREYVGHGIGRRMHEEPQIPNFGQAGTGPALRPGMVFAIEPMVNEGKADVKQLPDGWTVVTDDGRPSAHFEHTVAVTEDGPEVLTKER